jgi:pimeloyl-ACP methyl ester carboxylesterase
MKEMKHISHILHSQKSNRPFLLDISFLPDGIKKPVVVFVHGFKGFKDWGPFPLMADYFAQQGFVFLKFNLSQNGTTPETPLNFSDLEAFGNDNFTIQLEDLSVVLNFIEAAQMPLPVEEIAAQEIYLIGHSRGGSLVLLQASVDQRVKKLATWSAVSDILSAYKPEDIENWKTTGVRWIANARTQQQMPVYYQFYEDQVNNKNYLEILSVVKKLKQPLLILHGEKDETVPLSNAYDIYESISQSELVILANANHTFGSTHPYHSEVLPGHLKEICDRTISFFKKEV